MWWSYKPYVSVADRREKAAREMKKLAKKGRNIQPVEIEGRTIARTFWGKAWCDNLESYSDYDNRLPRGRTYVRNGSVCDLQVEPGRVTAMVCGSELYKIKISIQPLPPDHWRSIQKKCAGQIGSMIELLQGKLSQGVMSIITDRDSGLFPRPAEIELDCSCPDWADMCKHVAAALYGVGARLDEKPELLFVLRQVDHLELLSQAGNVAALTQDKSTRKTIAADALADVFGVELESAAPADPPPQTKPPKLSALAKTKRPPRNPSNGPRKVASTQSPSARRVKPRSKSKP